VAVGSRLTRWRLRFAGVGAVLVLAAACGSGSTESPPTASQSPGSYAAAPEDPLVQHLTGEVSADGAITHLQALQKIADEHGGNRAAASPGYAASVEYVVGVLRDAGFDVSTPTYQAPDDDKAAPGARNVVAQTRTGDSAHVVMIGAHLDSVPEGPGIVDDGSGVASLLEIASRLGGAPAVHNMVRFAFFGNEETGSQGSSGYLRGLSAGDRGNIAMYVNVDTVASPNAGYFVQGGQGTDEKSAGPAGSADIGRELADQLARTGVTPEIIKFVGDDELPFIKAGIPVGGAENGDAKKKTAEQAKDWGGQTGEAYDRCYHQACDRIDNVNRDVLDRYLRAVAGTLAHFATSAGEPR
jgi:aminopeptidase S